MVGFRTNHSQRPFSKEKYISWSISGRKPEAFLAYGYSGRNLPDFEETLEEEELSDEELLFLRAKEYGEEAKVVLLGPIRARVAQVFRTAANKAVQDSNILKLLMASAANKVSFDQLDKDWVEIAIDNACGADYYSACHLIDRLDMIATLLGIELEFNSQILARALVAKLFTNRWYKDLSEWYYGYYLENDGVGAGWLSEVDVGELDDQLAGDFNLLLEYIGKYQAKVAESEMKEAA